MTKREMKRCKKKVYAAARKLVSHKSLGLRFLSLMKNVDNFLPSFALCSLKFCLNKLLIFLYFLKFYLKSMNKNKVKIETCYQRAFLGNL